MKWRKLIENSVIGDAGAENGGLFYGNSVTDSEIQVLELKLKTKFPNAFYEIYAEFNGVGLQYDDEEIVWWLLPLSKIEESTKVLQNSWTDDPRSEALATELVIFGDWYNGDVFGYRRSKDGSIKSTKIYQYDHEVGHIDQWDLSLEDFLSERDET